MGDRCYMTLTIGGDISVVEVLEQVILAIKADGGQNNVNFQIKGVRESIVAALAFGYAPEFYFNEVNYANLDCFDTLSDLGLDLVAGNEAGGNYGSGWQTFDGLTGVRYEWPDSASDVLHMSFITDTFAEPITAEEKIEKIQAKIKEINEGQWNDPRPFTVSGAAADALAAEVARYKIEKAA